MRRPRRSLRSVLQRLLGEGLSPEKLSLTLALGLTLGTVPLVWGTSSLCFLAATRLKLNHPVMQLANYLAWPLQVALFLPCFKLGNTLFHSGPLPSSFDDLLRQFQGDWAGTLRLFGVANLQAVGAWCLAAPIFCGLLYLAISPLMVRISPAPEGLPE